VFEAARMADQPCVVANTDERWFEYLRSISDSGRLDEVNFWRPLANAFRALPPGAPLFFRLKAPIGAIVGYGFFAHFTFLPIGQAWITFRERNGDPSLPTFINRIAAYRKESPAESALGGRSLGCIVLREVRLLPEAQWIRWSESNRWHPRIQTYKSFELNEGVGILLRDLIQTSRPPDLEPGFELMSGDEDIGAAWAPVPRYATFASLLESRRTIPSSSRSSAVSSAQSCQFRFKSSSGLFAVQASSRARASEVTFALARYAIRQA